MRIKIVSNLIIFTLFLSLIISPAFAVNQVIIGAPIISNSKDMEITLDTCLINSSIQRNIVIIIDASGSTGGGDPSIGLSFMELIRENAINIIQNVSLDSRVGVVTFGGIPEKTGVLPMDIGSNKEVLERFINEVNPGGDNPTNLDDGLIATEELLNVVNGTKEIIVISDGIIPPDNFDRLKKIVVDIKKRQIKIHFVKVLLNNTVTDNKILEAIGLYTELAKASDSQVIVLNVDERVVVYSEKMSFEEPCPMEVSEPVLITVVSGFDTPIEGADVSFDGTSIGMTDRTGKISFSTIRVGLHNFTATKTGYNKAMRLVQVEPTSNITLNPIARVNQTPNTDLLLKHEVKDVEAPINKIEGSEISWIDLIISWLKSIFS